VSFSPVLANAAIGSTTTTVQATSQINGDAVVRAFTATLNVDRRRVLVSEWGVALASTPSGQVLARTLSVTDNFTGSAPAGLSWTSDSAWLTASSAGANGAPAMLTLTASPAALTSDVLHQATLTVRSTTPGIQAAVVRVGLYKTSSGVTSAQLLPQGYSHIVADRIGPYVYAHDGSTSIDIYDAQAARKVSTLSGVGVSLGQMAVSPDGSRLFALDTASRLLRVVDLRTSVVQSWPLDSAVDASVSIAALRPNGVDVVMLGDGTAYSEGRSLGVTDLRGALATNPDGRRVVAHGVSYGWTYTTVADVDYSEIGGGTLMLGNVAGTSSSEGAVEVDVAIDPSGSRLYTSTAGGGRCSVTSLTDLSFVGFLPGSPSYQSNVEILRDGRLVCSVITYEGAHRIRIYGPDGVLLADKADPSPGVLQGKLRTTSDGLLIVAPAVGARLLIMPSAP
jgi:DNA-binding beta-propeller fold protein YncE